MKSAPPTPSTLGTRLKRALRLRCVACGEAPMFRGWGAMRDCCGACGYVFEREGGYWLGAMYVNYGVTVAIAVVAHVVMADVYGLSTFVQMLTLLPASAAFVIWFFRYSRSLWLALDLTCDPPSDVDYREGGRRPS